MIDLWAENKESKKKFGKVILFMDLFDRDFKKKFKIYKELLEDEYVDFFIITSKKIIIDSKIKKEVIIL